MSAKITVSLTISQNGKILTSATEELDSEAAIDRFMDKTLSGLKDDMLVRLGEPIEIATSVSMTDTVEANEVTKLFGS